jgi:sugar lactone lactonase YvrE
VVANGFLYIADGLAPSGTIRQVNLTSGVITLLASGFNLIQGLALATNGDLVAADSVNFRIVRITPAGTVTVIAGGTRGFSPDGTLASAAQLLNPFGIAVDVAGNIFFTDGFYVRRINGSNNQLFTVSGAGEGSFLLPGVDGAQSTFDAPNSVVRASNGDIYFATSEQIFLFSYTGFSATRFAGNTLGGSTSNGVNRLTASLNAITSLQIDSAGNLYFLERLNNRIRKIDAATGIVSTVYNIVETFAANAIGVSPNGTIYVADASRIWLFNGTSLVSYAGTGVAGFSDNNNRGLAQFNFGNNPGQLISVSADGATLYVADVENHRIRQIGTNAITIAGNGVATDTGNGAAASAASINGPLSIFVDGTTAYVGTRSGVIRQFPLGGNISTIAGTGTFGFNAEFGFPANIQLSSVTGITVNNRGFIFLADQSNNRIRVVNVDANIPIAFLDSPVNGSTNLSGQVSVTGWAVDDFGVQRVEIKRAPIPADNPAAVGPDGLIFIGDALFILDSRPDIAAIYSTLPQNRRAGWGYPLLSYGLIDRGNTTYTLTAIAFDFIGRAVRTNDSTVTFNNNARLKPLGTVDNPSVGGVMFGAAANIGGWVLTPNPSNSTDPAVATLIPTNGSTIRLLIDSAEQGLPATYGINRGDVAANFAFPQFWNIPNVGVTFTYNSTQLCDGLHQVAFVASDNRGNEDGIGSRFFVSANNVAACGSADPPTPSFDPVSVWTPKARQASGTGQGMSISRGFAHRSTPERLRPMPDGSFEAVTPLDQRMVLDLGEPVTQGWLRIGSERVPLPAGSSLDRETGEFRWLAMGPYYGRFQFEFARVNGAGQLRVAVTVR